LPQYSPNGPVENDGSLEKKPSTDAGANLIAFKIESFQNVGQLPAILTFLEPPQLWFGA
jgi:hypothetical protein